MNRSKWNVLASTAAMCAGLAANALAATSAAQPPAKSATPQAAQGYWAGDGQSSKGGSYLGVDVADLTKERVSALKLKDEHGVEITMVDQDAPAGKAGLKEHDVILEFNGKRIEGEEQLKRLIHETPSGRPVTLTISRDGQSMQLPVTLGERSKTMVWGNFPMVAPYPPKGVPAMPLMPDMPAIPPMPPMPVIPEFDIPDMNVLVRSYSPSAGMMVDNLTPQLGEFFGVKDGHGVLVRSVEKGSAAENAGLKAGDVIVKVGDEKVTDRSDWRRALRARKSGKVSLGIVREKREQTLTITLPNTAPRDSSRMHWWILQRDKNGEVLENIDDDSESFNVDAASVAGWAALRSSADAQRAALKEVNQQMRAAQKISADQVNQSLKQLRPQMELQMKQVQKQIQAQIQQMQEQLRDWQDKD